MRRILNKNLFTIGLIVILLVTSLTASFSYAVELTPDTYGKLLFDITLITGYNGDLMEDETISRVQMIAILCKLYPSEFTDFSPPTTATFDDVSQAHWGYKYVEFAYYKGITVGKSARIFGVNDAVNYNQVSIFLIKSLGFTLLDIPYENAADGIAQHYGLKLLVPTNGKESLLRQDVFELIVKALSMETAKGNMGISLFTDKIYAQEIFFMRSYELVNTPVPVYMGSGFYNLYYINGNLYTGGFDGTDLQGNGIMKFGDGDVYIGQFLNSQFSGYGIFIWTQGEYYEGEWVEDMYNGLGTYTYPDGSYQYGQWYNDQLITVIKEVTPEDIALGIEIPSIICVFTLIDAEGAPIEGIDMTVFDQTNDIYYNRITNKNGEISIPKVSDFSLININLNENSVYRFSLSKEKYMVTTVGQLNMGKAFELFR